jgi:hypothetical protein
MKIVPIISLWFAATPLVAVAEGIPRTVLIQTERFTLSQQDAYELLQANHSDARLRQEMLKRVTAETARLEQFLMLQTVVGQRAKVEQIDEFPYATDFEPQKMPKKLILADAAGAALLPAVDSLTPQSPPTPPEEVQPPTNDEPKPKPPTGPFHNAGIGLQTTPAPTAMTVRNLGDTLEVDPELTSTDKTVLVTYTIETVHYLGDSTYNGTFQPNFQTQRVNAVCAAKPGRPVFLGTCSKAVRSGVAQGQDRDELSLQFMTVFTRPVTPSEHSPLTEAQMKRKTVRCHFELISLPQQAAHTLIEARTADEITLDRLHEMIVAKTATLEASADFKGLNGQRTKVQQMKPYSYPTEFAHHLIPETVTITDPKIMDILHLHGGGPTPDPDNLSQAIITTSTPDPATFTSRDLGFTGEIDPLLHPDGESFSITLALEIVRHVGDRNLVGNLKPVFETQKVNTSVHIKRNVPILLGTLSRPQSTGAPGGNVEKIISLAFITVTAD